MADLKDLFYHNDAFTQRVTHVDVLCECPHCHHVAPFSQWEFLNGMDDGDWCEDCGDFHSCFQCPACDELIGAAGNSNGTIIVHTDK
jgi:hypothetical protein